MRMTSPQSSQQGLRPERTLTEPSGGGVPWVFGDGPRGDRNGRSGVGAGQLLAWVGR